MNWEFVKIQLEQILHTSVQIKKLSSVNWRRIETEIGANNKIKSIEHEHEVHFILNKSGGAIYVLVVEAEQITPVERQLVEMMIEAYHLNENKNKGLNHSEEERKLSYLRDWIYQQLENGLDTKELPDSFASQSALFSAKVPLLLYGDYSDSRIVGYKDLKKLLESFFSVETILIPLQDKEWLILCSEALLDAEDDEKGASEYESREETLESICLGLYEMMVSEGIGECHLSIDYPMIPSQSLLGTILKLREAISLGRTFYIGSNIHLPWKLHLERVLSLLPDSEKKKIVEHIFKGNDVMMDSETMLTLDHFFELDCNVSETAKQLYIHRNTLLYRLDKFKHETGLDVRKFTDAVLVKISMLLYKVTKRK